MEWPFFFPNVASVLSTWVFILVYLFPICGFTHTTNTSCYDVVMQLIVVMFSLFFISWQGWPAVHPDILVATPAALLNYLFDYDPEKRRRERFLRDVKFVVSI